MDLTEEGSGLAESMWKMLTRPPRAIVCPHAARSVARNKRCGAARHSPHPAGVQSHAGTRESLGRGGRWALSREMRPALLPSWQAPVVLHECVARSFHGGRSIAADVAAEPSRTDRDWDVVDEDAQAEMWRKLYARDYTEKADLAKFLAAATELVEERQAKREAESRTGGDLAASLDDDFAICSTEHGGYELPAGTPITLEVVHEMVRNFVDGQRLRRASLVRLLDEGQAILAACPNITLIPAGTKTCVIGDLHGDFDDLLQVFELVGWPGEENTMVFNGDFVDRGDRGIECLALLLALKICHPMHVHLNRGNHEDSIVGRAYGFFEEVMVKYGQVSLYQRIGELFCHLPLCAVLEKEAFIVHAGVPSEADATIYHIGAVARSNITSTVAAKWAASRAPGAATARPRSLQLVEDLLWSDPVDPADEPGAEEMCERNMMRGAGCRFGPALVQRWLKKMELFTLVRSHECVEDGWRVLDCGANTKLYTVFSNANYQVILCCLPHESPGDTAQLVATCEMSMPCLEVTFATCCFFLMMPGIGAGRRQQRGSSRVSRRRVG